MSHMTWAGKEKVASSLLERSIPRSEIPSFPLSPICSQHFPFSLSNFSPRFRTFILAHCGHKQVKSISIKLVFGPEEGP